MCIVGSSRRMRSILLSAVGITIWACSPFSLLAQDGTASLSGVVQDPTGAAIGGNGSVVLEAAGSGVRQVTQPDQRGSFRFSGLNTGTYTLSVRVPGFDTLKITQIVLAGEQRSLPAVRLSVGGSGCFSSDADPVWTHFLPTDQHSEPWRGTSRILSNPS
jgi:carboxypeptidase family protein